MIKDLVARDVTVTCTACSHQFTVERTGAGMACTCPECGESLSVPKPPPGLSWTKAILAGGVVVGALFGWAYFTNTPAVETPSGEETPAKQTAVPAPAEDPFVSQAKFLPKAPPQIVDRGPAADPFISAPFEPSLLAQAEKAEPKGKGPEKTEGKTPPEKGNDTKKKTEEEFIERPTKLFPSASNAALEEAVTAFRKNDLGRTQEILKEARIRYPDLPPAGFMLAELYLTHNLIPAGRAELEKVALDDPKYPGTYLMFGNLSLSEGRATDALVLFERALALKDEIKDAERKKTLETNVRSGMVNVFEARKDWPAVIAAADEWLKLDPKSGRAHQRLAHAYLAKGMLKEATEELAKAHKGDRNLALPDVALATFYTEFNDLRSAEEAILRAVKEFPKDPRVQQAAAAWYLGQERAKDAQPFAAEALKLDPTSTDIRFLSGVVARQARDFKAAEAAFEQVLRDAPANFAASNQLALVLAEQEEEGKRRRAVEMAEVNARQYPRNVDAVATLGWAYYRNGKLDQAEQALQSAVSGGRATSDIAYYLAHVMADRGRIDDAAKLLQGALKSQGTFTFRKEAQVWHDRITSKPKK